MGIRVYTSKADTLHSILAFKPIPLWGKDFLIKHYILNKVCLNSYTPFSCIVATKLIKREITLPSLPSSCLPHEHGRRGGFAHLNLPVFISVPLSSLEISTVRGGHECLSAHISPYYLCPTLVQIPVATSIF